MVEERKFSQEQYDILKRCSDTKDITEWNERRKDKPDEDILLEKAEMEGFWLKGAWLLTGNLYLMSQVVRLNGKVFLQEANLRKANLQEAKLWEANLQKADLREADLQKAKLREANLQEADLQEANLQKANLRKANLQEAYLWKANLQEAKLVRANLQEAKLWEANLQKAYLWKANLQKAKLGEANLQEADLQEANLQEADLRRANLRKANLCKANLRGAILQFANLQYASFKNAHAENADFYNAKVQAASFRRTHVNGSTSFWKVKVNQRTPEVGEKYSDFAGVGLNNVRIDSATKQLLEYNIRGSNWERWYPDKSRWLSFFVRKFWGISDYGLSTWKIVKSFMVLAVVFALIYYAWGAVDCYVLKDNVAPGLVDNLFVVEGKILPWWNVPFRSVYFSFVTMTTLGFGDLHASSEGVNSLFGYLLLTIQVILGYIMLGALVTRFAVLFTAGGPAGEFTEMEEPEEVKEESEEQDDDKD